MGYSIFRTEVELSVALSILVVSVDWRRVVECEVVAVVVVAVAVESARIAEDVETPALLILLLDDPKAKARMAGVSCRLARQNIQTRAVYGDVECIQVSFRVILEQNRTKQLGYGRLQYILAVFESNANC